MLWDSDWYRDREQQKQQQQQKKYSTIMNVFFLLRYGTLKTTDKPTKNSRFALLDPVLRYRAYSTFLYRIFGMTVYKPSPLIHWQGYRDLMV